MLRGKFSKVVKTKDKNTKYAKQKCKWNFTLIMYETMNVKWSEQGYDATLYFKLVLNILKVMGMFFIIISLWEINLNKFYVHHLNNLFWKPSKL